MYNPQIPAGLIFMLLAIAALMIISFWKIFEKAGEPGWAAIVPIYNLLILVKIAGREGWWVLLLIFIPLIPQIIIYNDIAKKFGKEGGFTVGMVLLPIIFFPILAFGDATYQGPKPTSATGPLDQM